MHKPRKDMIAETRAKLIAAGRKAFAEKGYAEASMDDLTAAVGLTRGALYHHFGGKPGLLAAVIAEIDAEMNKRLADVSAKAPTPVQGFIDENVGYIGMALEPEIQRIVLRDGPAVLGDPSTWPSANACVRSITASLDRLKADGLVSDIDSEAAAWLITGATTYAAQWIANADDPRATSEKAIPAVKQLLEGFLSECKLSTNADG